MPQDRKPLPPQTAHKAWAAAFGALAANVVIWLLAYVDTVTTAETYGLLVTLFTPLGAGLAAYAKRNWVKVVGGILCHPLAVALTAALLLAGSMAGLTRVRRGPSTMPGRKGRELP